MHHTGNHQDGDDYSRSAYSTQQGIPVSSTHAINGAIVGVGATRGRTAVQWKVVREMVTAWVITIPLALVLSWAGYQIITLVLGVL